MFRYIFTIFLSAFLLFQVQPLIAKFILPWFGGTPAVWTTCMLFFQVLLLGGYCYAHLGSVRMSPRTQALTHLVLLAATVVFLPAIPSDSWKPGGEEEPILRILLLLGATIGLPYFMLSSTGPLVQKWFSRTHPDRSPYWLFALSNIGSFLGLLTYPLLVEPNLHLETQAYVWSIAFGVFVLMCGWCAWGARDTIDTESLGDPFAWDDSPPKTKWPVKIPLIGRTLNSAIGRLAYVLFPDRKHTDRPSVIDVLLWLSLAMVASLMLLAITNQMCQEVAVVPFLWVLPLSVYLLSFVLSFAAGWNTPNNKFLATLQFPFRMLFGGYSRGFWATVALAVFAYGLLCWKHDEVATWLTDLSIHWNDPSAGEDGGWVSASLDRVRDRFFVDEDTSWFPPSMWGQIVGLTTALFVVCMISHGELARSRPAPKYLTLFYLMLSVGGALGGLFVAVVAPMIYSEFTEIYIGGYLFAALVFVAYTVSWVRHEGGIKSQLLPAAGWLVATGVCWFVATKMLTLANTDDDKDDLVLERSRNFYGLLSIKEDDYGTGWEYLSLMHGVIEHGKQYKDPDYRDMKASYYNDESGVGIAINLHPSRGGGPAVAEQAWLNRQFDDAGLPDDDQTRSEAADFVTAMMEPEQPRSESKFTLGVIGLGAGTLAAYGQQGDSVVFYDINLEVIRLADSHFFYLQDCRDRGCDVTVVAGDARVQMEREIAEGKPHGFDVLAVDAFSSDAIPMHLLTRECLQTYWKQLKPDGILAVHISNRYLDLRPVVRGLAADAGYEAIVIDWDEDDESDPILSSSRWVLVTKNEAFLKNPDVQNAIYNEENPKPNLIWTDSYGSLLQVMTK